MRDMPLYAQLLREGLAPASVAKRQTILEEHAEQVETDMKALGVTASQIAVAWVPAQGEDIIPIPGTKRRTWLDQNISALDVVLSAAELAELDKNFPPDAAAGLRYPESFMGAVNA